MAKFLILIFKSKLDEINMKIYNHIKKFQKFYSKILFFYLVFER